MKRMQVLAMVMAVMMLVGAVPALAVESSSIEIGNIKIAHSDGEELDLGLGLKGEITLDGDNFAMSAAVQGNGEDIVHIKVGLEGEQFVLGMDGLKNNYTIAAADLEAMAKQIDADVQVPAMPSKEIEDLIAAYKAMIEEAEAQEANPPTDAERIEMIKEMGFEDKGEAAVEIHGKAFTMHHYEGKFDVEDFDRLLTVSLKKSPSAKLFLEKYVEVLQKVAAQSGEDVHFEFDIDHLYSSMLTGEDIALDSNINLWMDDAGENVRVEMLMNVTSEDETAQVPYIVEVTTDENGEHVTMNMDMNADGESVKMTMAVNDAKLSEGARGDMKVDMDVADMSVSFFAAYDYDAAGAGTIDATVKVEDGTSEPTDFTFSVKSTGGDTNTHHVQFGTVSGDIATIAFDVTLASKEVDAVAFDDGGKPTVSIKDMTEEDQKLLEEELMTKGFMAYGQLMATDGVAKLMSDVMTDVEGAMEEVETEMTASEDDVAA